MAHTCIIGMTESGKTSLARALAQAFRRRRVCTIALDPIGDPSWPVDQLYHEPEPFEKAVRQSRSAMIFVDESGAVIDRHDDRLWWLATRSRHWGHSVFFLAQRAVQVPKTVRDQCSTLYLFAVSQSDADALAEEWACPQLHDAPNLPRGNFILVGRFAEPVDGRVIFGARPRLELKHKKSA